jgi:hypothetical protein
VKVSDFQQHVADLAKLLKASGAKGVATDLTAIRDGLNPFRDQPLKTFADFLIRAEAYSRGEVPVKPPPRGKRPSGAGKRRATPANAQGLAGEIKELYERVAEPATNAQVIDVALAKLGPLTKDGLVVVAEAIGLLGMKRKGKEHIKRAIRQRVLARKGAAQRAGIIDRPEGTSVDHN